MPNKIAVPPRESMRRNAGPSIDGMADLTARPGYLIRRAQQVSWALFAEECGSLDITSIQYAALVAIRENPGVDATRLSGLIAFDRSTLGGVLERLEVKGFVVRYPSASDKRVKLLHLSPAGEDLLRAAQPGVERVQQRLLAPFAPPEREALLRMLRALVDLHEDVAAAPLRPVQQS